MAEMADTGDHHPQASRVRRGQGLGITNRSAWMDDGRNARRDSYLDRVRKREKCVGGHNASAGLVAGSFHSNAHAIDPVGLSTANAYGRFALG